MRTLQRIAMFTLAVNLLAAEARTAEPEAAELPPAYFLDLAELKVRYKLYSEALNLYKTALEKSSDKIERSRCQMGIAFVLEAQGNAAEALNVWKSLAAAADDPVIAARARLILGQRYAETGQTDDAIAALEAVALHEKMEIVRQTAASKLSALLLTTPRANEKLVAYQQLLAANPKDLVLLQLVINLQKDDPAGRAATFSAVSKSATLDVYQMDQWASALIDAGKSDEATQLYQTLAKNDPAQAGLLYDRLAAIAVKNGKPEEAEALVLFGSNLEPGDVRGELELCRKLLALNLLAGAEKHGRAAFAAANEPVMKSAVAMELGEALFRQRKFDEARVLLAPLAHQDAWQGLQQRAKSLLAKFPPPSQSENF